MGEFIVGESYNLADQDGWWQVWRQCRGSFAPGELVLINILGPAEWPDRDEDGRISEGWANVLYEAVSPGFAAPDFGGTTGGDPRGINILIPAADLAAWEQAAAEIGAEVHVAPVQPGPGRYGDGQWAGAYLREQDGRLFWFE